MEFCNEQAGGDVLELADSSDTPIDDNIVGLFEEVFSWDKDQLTWVRVCSDQPASLMGCRL